MAGFILANPLLGEIRDFLLRKQYQDGKEAYFSLAF